MLIVFNMLTIAEAFAQDGLQVGTEIYFFNYKEPNFMEDSGVFYGVNTSYMRHFNGFDLFNPEPVAESPEARSMVRLDGRIAFGQVDYTSEGTGELDNINDFAFETRMVTGYDFTVSEKSFFTPYLGLGYRYLKDDTSGKTTTLGAAGYERQSNYFYLPIGADLYGHFSGQWDADLNAEFDVFLIGRQKSHLGDAISGLNTISNDQNNGYGARGSIRFTRDNGSTDLFIEPFIRYWHIDDSEISGVTFNNVLVGYGLEPENKTLEAGVKIGLKF